MCKLSSTHHIANTSLPNQLPGCTTGNSHCTYTKVLDFYASYLFRHPLRDGVRCYLPWEWSQSGKWKYIQTRTIYEIPLQEQKGKAPGNVVKHEGEEKEAVEIDKKQSRNGGPTPVWSPMKQRTQGPPAPQQRKKIKGRVVCYITMFSPLHWGVQHSFLLLNLSSLGTLKKVL